MERIDVQILDVALSQILEELVEMVKMVPQKWTVGQLVELRVPQIAKEFVAEVSVSQYQEHGTGACPAAHRGADCR